MGRNGVCLDQIETQNIKFGYCKTTITIAHLVLTLGPFCPGRPGTPGGPLAPDLPSAPCWPGGPIYILYGSTENLCVDRQIKYYESQWVSLCF